jgi:hypothetical protein
VKQYWKGEITFADKGPDTQMFKALNWLVKAASKDTTRYFMTGIFNEVVDGNRVFVATDGWRLHKIEFNGKPEALAGIPAGKNLAFKAGSKQITFTGEIDGDFPPYKRVVPDIADSTSFAVFVSKRSGYAEALYGLYSRNIKMSALHVAGLDNTGCAGWTVYHTKGKVVCTQNITGAVYTAVSALWAT